MNNQVGSVVFGPTTTGPRTGLEFLNNPRSLVRPPSGDTVTLVPQDAINDHSRVYVYRDPRGVPNVGGRRPVLPTRGTTQAAAYDVTAFLPEEREMRVRPLQTVKVPTGLFFAIPKDSAMLICSRSGLASKGLMVANGPGILDSDYRGELLVLLTYVASPDREDFTIKHGDRIAQLLFTPASALLNPTFVDVTLQSELPVPDSNRTGGFGSTGR